MNDEPIPALIEKLIAETRTAHPGRPALIGVGGAQGSGKSYWSAPVAAKNPRVAHFSLDDVYLTRREREAKAAYYADPSISKWDRLSQRLWPEHTEESYQRALKDSAHLFVTRGPPGTHDLGIAQGVIARLRTPAETLIPHFDKKNDDRAPESAWRSFHGPAEAILIDGWCMGALPPEDTPPLNEVEREDVLGDWRQRQQSELAGAYGRFFQAFDSIVYLQAPSFEIVRAWRGEQEEKLLRRMLTDAENAGLDRFIQHYERITRAMLAGRLRADWIVRLDENRNVLSIERRS